MPSVTRPHVLFVSLNGNSMFESEYENLITKIGINATIHRVFLPIPAIRVLIRNFHAVFLTDGALTQPKNILVWEAVIQYLHTGGTVICMGCFSSATPAGMARFFQKVHFRWRMDERHTAPVYMNMESLPRATRRKLPAAYGTDAVYLKDVSICDAWYRPTEEDITSTDVVEAGNLVVNPWTYSAAMGKVGLGSLAYVGDTHSSPEYETLVLTMAELI